jgi:hypothetical protein
MSKFKACVLLAVSVLLIAGCAAQRDADAPTVPAITATRRPTNTPYPPEPTRPIIVTDDGDPYIPLTISPLLDDPCAAPCWYGITPGITTIDEAWTILFEDWDQESVCPYTFTRDAIGCENYRVYAPAEHEVVERITLTPTERLTMAEIIQAFGEPEVIYLHQIGIDYPEAAEIILPFRDQRVSIFFVHHDWVYGVEPFMVLSHRWWWIE